MKRIVGEKISELCTELCQRIGDSYKGPYMMSFEKGDMVLTFWGQKGVYTAVPTAEGLYVKNNEGAEIAHFPDITDFTF